MMYFMEASVERGDFFGEAGEHIGTQTGYFKGEVNQQDIVEPTIMSIPKIPYPKVSM